MRLRVRRRDGSAAAVGRRLGIGAFVVAVVVVGVVDAGCPQQGPPCTGDPESHIENGGEACDGCTIDFGDVDVALQEHRRVDFVQGCQDEFFDQPLVDGAGFAAGESQFAFIPGSTGFMQVDFTPTSAGDWSGTVTWTTESATLHATLHGVGVDP